jgi:putative addiction module component (TIGR02574 family)
MRDSFTEMADPTRDLESTLLGLPAEDRARLAARLISSLEPGSDPDAEQAWLAEAERRLDELESGKVDTVPADKVFEKARSTLK